MKKMIFLMTGFCHNYVNLYAERTLFRPYLPVHLLLTEAVGHRGSYDE